VELVASN